MDIMKKKFSGLDTSSAPGQDSYEKDYSGYKPSSVVLADFSHGDVNAFPPVSDALEYFISGVGKGSTQAYTKYRGDEQVRKVIAERLGRATRTTISGNDDIIITSGTQGALFLSIASVITSGKKIAIAQPDYFTNRKIALFLGAEVVSIDINYNNTAMEAGLDFDQLKYAFESGVKVFVFSNPNNPVGVVYSEKEIRGIADLSEQYDVTVIVDQLYSRLVYDNRAYTNLCAVSNNLDNLVTIMGPSKTESLSGYRLGAAFGAKHIIDRMERLQALVSLRAAGYNQFVLNSWFAEPSEWINDRIYQHQLIRDDIVSQLRANNISVRLPEGGSYIFPLIPNLTISIQEFIEILKNEAHVVVTPGFEFGNNFINNIRLNFSQDRTVANDAVKIIIALIKQYRK